MACYLLLNVSTVSIFYFAETSLETFLMQNIVSLHFVKKRVIENRPSCYSNTGILNGCCPVTPTSCDELLIFLFILLTGVGSQGQLYDVSVVLSQKGTKTNGDFSKQNSGEISYMYLYDHLTSQIFGN